MKLKKENYESDRNEIHRDISGFTYENSSPKDIKELLNFCLDFILEYTPSSMTTPTHTALREEFRTWVNTQPRSYDEIDEWWLERTLPRSTGTESWEEFFRSRLYNTLLKKFTVDETIEIVNDANLFISQHFVSRAEVGRVIDWKIINHPGEGNKPIRELLEDLKQALLQ